MNSLFKLTFLLNFIFINSVSAQKQAHNRVFYFSFLQNKTVDLSEVKEFTFNKSIRVCTGSTISIDAPIKVNNALYVWNSPDGNRIYTQDLYFDKITEAHQGVYTVSIASEKETIIGNIALSVIKSPEPELKITKNKDFYKFNLLGLSSSTQITWKNNIDIALSNYNELIISKKEKETSGLFVELQNEHCKNTLRVE